MILRLLCLVLLLLANNIKGFQPETPSSRLPWVGPKLRLALRQAKRSHPFYNPGKAWKAARESSNGKEEELDEISSNLNQLDKVSADAKHLEEMIKILQQGIEDNWMMVR